MRLLLTNDDGIDAPGLAALEAAATAFGGEAIVVAPAEPHSGCGHRLTTDRPLAVHAVSARRYRVDGTPADCIRLGLAQIAGDVDLVLSGINAGGNLGIDVHHSGTVAAAREAALHGLPAVAVSQLHRGAAAIDWPRASRWLEAVLARLLAEARHDDPAGWWNVNFPAATSGDRLPPLIECGIDPSPIPPAYEGDHAGWRYAARYHERPRRAGHDVAHCFDGAITLSRGGLV